MEHAKQETGQGVAHARNLPRCSWHVMPTVLKNFDSQVRGPRKIKGRCNWRPQVAKLCAYHCMAPSQ
jgi:hypothetical protein